MIKYESIIGYGMVKAPPGQVPTETRVQAVENSLKIVEAMMKLGGAGGITEIAGAVDMSKSSIHKHLATLREKGFVTKDGDRYRLGLRFLEIGSFVRERYSGMEHIKQKIREIAIETDEIAFFSIEENGRPTILFREVGHKGVPTRSRVGMRLYLHQIAAGKAILSTYSEEEVETVIEKHGLPEATPQTITNFDELMADLKRTRERGYSLSVGEATEGLQAVGVPVTLPSGKVLGGCAVAGPIHRMAGEKSEEEISKLLHSVANELELRIAHSR